MLGVGIPNFGELYLLLIFYCLLVAVLLKAGASVARTFGVQELTTVNIGILWVFVIGTSLLTAILVIPFLLARIPYSQLITLMVFVVGVWLASWFSFFEKNHRNQSMSKTLGISFLLSLSAVGISSLLAFLWFMAKHG